MRTELFTILKRKASDLLSEFEENKEPILISQHGLPSAYLIGAESFEDIKDRLTLLEGIARGELAIEDGQTLTQEEAKSRMSRWLK